jgi:hypothetical protein
LAQKGAGSLDKGERGCKNEKEKGKLFVEGLTGWWMSERNRANVTD